MLDATCDRCGLFLTYVESLAVGRCVLCRAADLTTAAELPRQVVGPTAADRAELAAILDDADDCPPEPGSGLVAGVGADAPMVSNEFGGKQSKTLYRMDLLQPLAVLRVAKIMEYGAGKYGENNWHAITTNEHLNHALIHIFALLAGDLQDDHLGHAAWRVLSALEQQLSGRDADLLARKAGAA